jgi:putative peptide maturation dehydrogenase
MKGQTTRFRRRKIMLVRVADDSVLDVRQFLQAKVSFVTETRCSLLCPVTGKSLTTTPSEIDAVMKVPADRWVSPTQLRRLGKASAMLADLAARGILLADPAPEQWRDLVDGEDAIVEMQWDETAAVCEARSRWQGVVGAHVYWKPGERAHRARLRDLLNRRGDPPPHFGQRRDALRRSALKLPSLDEPFFQTLCARRTTRSFKSDEPLPQSALETMLYAVFGAQGLKIYPYGIAAVKRTSASGGALHPIDAYVLVLNVQGFVPGLYHYEAGTHALATLEELDTAEARALACRFTASQGFCADAHALIIHVVRFDRSLWKYGKHRKAYKTVMMDSGHLSQTFYLTAAHLGLGAFCVGAINDVDIANRLRLSPVREAAVAINGLGIADPDRNELNFDPSPYSPSEAT